MKTKKVVGGIRGPATPTEWTMTKTLVVVSHDRGFLNEVTTDIIHLH